MASSIHRRNNVSVGGHGTQPMLFAHGFGCDQEIWRSVTPFFEKDYQIITFDFVGHGKSDLSSYKADRYASLHGYAQDIIDIARELHLKDIIFVGHSVSCMIGMLAAIQAPELFSKLIMVSPSPHYLNHSDYKGGFDQSDIEEMLDSMSLNYQIWAGNMGPAIMGNQDRPELGAGLTASFCATDPIVAGQFAAVTFLSDNRKDLKNSPVPSLILQCANDLLAPPGVAEFMAEKLPDSSLYYMKASGHCPHASAPIETATLIQKFLLTSQ